MRAQVFSIDFVVATTILLLGLGIALQTVDLVQKDADTYANMQTNNAETVAEGLMRSVEGFANHSPYCFRYSNGTSTCGGFSCAFNTFTATRLVNCEGAVCSMEVRTCE
ncbi:MAG: hypothetical protein V1787_00705 [Candidatus Micrarchaeota archaeon]